MKTHMNLRAIAIGIVMLMLPNLTSGQFFQHTKQVFQSSPVGEATVIVEEWSITIEEYWIESDSTSLLECHTSFANWLEFSNKQRHDDTPLLTQQVSYPSAMPLTLRQKDLSPLISLFKIK
jgi:hypothetical protein